MTVVLHCNHVSKTFWSTDRMGRPDVQALRDVCLSVDEGQLAGLVGPIGAGKTTLLSLFTGLFSPTEGLVTVAGHSPQSPEAKRLVGYVPEHPDFSGYCRAVDVLYDHAMRHGLAPARRAERVRSVVERLDLGDAAEVPCAEFSHGLKQRLAIAVALLDKPRIVLLDEPTNGLDPLGVIAVRDLLLDLHRSGVTILVSTHHLHELGRLTTDVIFLVEGQVVTSPQDSSYIKGTDPKVGLTSGDRFGRGRF